MFLVIDFRQQNPFVRMLGLKEVIKIRFPLNMACDIKTITQNIGNIWKASKENLNLRDAFTRNMRFALSSHCRALSFVMWFDVMQHCVLRQFWIWKLEFIANWCRYKMWNVSTQIWNGEYRNILPLQLCPASKYQRREEKSNKL